ncbi:MAG: hypothetical protein CAK90_05830 [Spartobacteria bacterium AMD-G4]|nr:MAG: hypothetical protein CAK90_05830 [Spartobacteria bacterium AMD-G4]
MIIFRICLGLPGGIDHRKPSVNIEHRRRFEGECPIRACRLIAGIHDRNRGQLESAVLEAFNMDDGCQFVLTLQINVEAGEERAVEYGNDPFA